MNLLPFNADISRRLHLKPYNFLVVLPTVFMFAAFGPFFLIMSWLERVFPVSSSQSVMERLPSACVFGFALLIFLLAADLLGWLFNAWVLRVSYKWSTENLRQLFLYSQVPESWIKDSIPSDTKFSWSDKIKAFQSFRSSGTPRQKFIILGLIAGLGIFMSALLPVLEGKVENSVLYIFSGACLCAIGGVLFGLAVWLVDEKFFRK
jgi:hypothetical protein